MYSTCSLRQAQDGLISSPLNLKLVGPTFYLAAVEKNREKAWYHTSRTGNGGLDSYVMWQCAHEICGQYTEKRSNSKDLGVLPTVTDFTSTKSLTKDVWT